ncbi:hypothetical protein PMAYCL1PPCAC_20208, partial [Pristionchus mayeri]
ALPTACDSSSCTMDLCEASEELKQKYFSRIADAEMLDNMVFTGFASETLACLATREFGPGDIVIVSYPKSGSTWTMELLSAIVHEGDTELIGSIQLERRVPFIDIPFKYWPPPSPVKARKNVYLTHLPLRYLPPSIREGKCKMVYVVRNPKDTAVSFLYHHKIAVRLGLQNDLTWAEFFQLFCSGFVVRGDWFEHVRDYWTFTRNNQNVSCI